MCEKYNGWTNYETWLAKLWMDNDYYVYKDMQAIGEMYKKTGESIFDFSKYIKNTMEESMPDLRASLFSDLLNASFSQIDFYEIAENIYSDIEVEEEDTEDDNGNELEIILI